MKQLLKIVLLLAVVAAIAKLVMMKREWSGLSETQVREKIDAGLSRKVEDAAKRQEIADKVVTAMRDKGVLRERDARGSSSQCRRERRDGDQGSRLRRPGLALTPPGTPGGAC